MLEVYKHPQDLRWLHGRRRREPRRSGARHHRRDRAERRRQVDAVQPDHRPSARRQRQCRARGPRHHRHPRRTRSAAWASAARSSAPTSSPSSPCSRTCRPPSSRMAARRATSGAAPRDSIATRRRRCSPRSASPDRRTRSAASCRTAKQKQVELGIALACDPKICCWTSRPPACRQRDARGDPAARAHRQGAQAHAAVHRARHGGRVLDRAEDRRAAPGPADRRGDAGGGAQHPEVRRVYLGGRH